MQQQLSASPQTRPDQNICGTIAVALLAVGGWQAKVILDHPDTVQVWRFLIVVLAAVGAIYLAYLVVALSRVTYALKGRRFVVCQGRREWEIPIKNSHLYRWRHRWNWGDTALTDLGVERVDRAPLIWFVRPGATWVLVYEVAERRRRAIVIRPPAQMVALLRGQASERKGA